MRIQHTLNSDIAMIFDECTPYPATYDEAGEVDAHVTALASARATNTTGSPTTRHPDRARRHVRESARELLTALADIGFGRIRHRRPLGPVSRRNQMARILAHTTPRLPQNKPRYLIGESARPSYR